MAEQQALARALDHCYLLVQGPPGTGKTYTGARLIVDLIDQGHRVGVTALSHRAINKLVEEIEKAARERGVRFRGARKIAAHPAGRVPDGGQVENVSENGGLPRSCVSTRRRHDLALRAGDVRRPTRLPRHRRGRSALARRRARRGHGRAQPDPARRPAAAAAGVAGDRTRRARTRACSSICSASHATVPEDRGVFLDRDVANASGRVPVHLRRGVRGSALEPAQPAARCRRLAPAPGSGTCRSSTTGNGSQSPEEADRSRLS